MSWHTAGLTHPGKKRKYNEDAFLARPEIGLWAVADGMGGHAAGDVASAQVAESLGALDPDGDLVSLVDAVDDALIRVNESLREYSARELQGRTVGCTVVAFVADAHVGVCLWAGDSRLYRRREGVIEQITQDHSPVEDAVARGELTPEEAATHPDSNVITRAVGGQSALTLDVAVVDIEAGDTYLLCSDGLYRELSTRDIGEFLDIADVEDAAQGMLDLALHRGARDNVGIVVARPV